MKMHLNIIKGYENHNDYLTGDTYREFTDFVGDTPNFDEFIYYCRTHHGKLFFDEKNIIIENYNEMNVYPKAIITFGDFIKLIGDTICQSYRENDHFEFDLHEFKRLNEHNITDEIKMPEGYENCEKHVSKLWKEGTNEKY